MKKFALVLVFLAGCSAQQGTSPVNGPPKDTAYSVYVAGQGYRGVRPIVAAAAKTELLKADDRAKIVASDTAAVAAYDTALAAVSLSSDPAGSTKALVDATNGISLTVDQALSDVQETAVAKVDKNAAYTKLTLDVVMAGVQGLQVLHETQGRLQSDVPIALSELQDISALLHAPL